VVERASRRLWHRVPLAAPRCLAEQPLDLTRALLSSSPLSSAPAGGLWIIPEDLSAPRSTPRKTAEDTRRYAKMIARELRAKAGVLRRTARLVSDDDIARALIELAEHYEDRADATSEKE
jgi:hypothetical protein